MKCSISVYMITYYSVVQFTNLTIILLKLRIAPCPDMALFNLLWGTFYTMSVFQSLPGVVVGRGLVVDIYTADKRCTYAYM